jgi:hypothetical protein
LRGLNVNPALLPAIRRRVPADFCQNGFQTAVCSIKLFYPCAVIASNGAVKYRRLTVRVLYLRRTMMAQQDWAMAGIYLVGLVSMVLLMSGLTTRATRKRVAVSIASSSGIDE